MFVKEQTLLIVCHSLLAWEPSLAQLSHLVRLFILNAPLLMLFSSKDKLVVKDRILVCGEVVKRFDLGHFTLEHLRPSAVSLCSDLRLPTPKWTSDNIRFYELADRPFIVVMSESVHKKNRHNILSAGYTLFL